MNRKFKPLELVLAAFPFLILATGVVIFFRAVLFQPNAFIPWDLPGFHLPQAVYISQVLRSGSFPFWDPSMYCGRPFFAEIQAQVLYPFRLLTVALAGGSTSVAMLRGLELELILHVMLAGFAAYLLARRYGMGRPAATLTGTGYSLGCYFATQTQHIGAIETAAWLPMSWLAMRLAFERQSWLRFTFLAGSLAMLILGGFTPSMLVMLMALGLLTLGESAITRSARPLLILMLAVGAAVALTAVQLGPTNQLSDLSVGSVRSTWRGTGGGMPVEALATLVRPSATSAFNFDKFIQLHPSWEISLSYLYCGIPVLLLALAGLVAGVSKQRYLIAAVLLVAGVWMLGDSTPIGKALYLALPSKIRGPLYPQHWMAVFSLCLALLAGFGLERLSRGRAWAYAIVVVAAADLIAAGAERPFNFYRDSPAWVGMDQAVDGDPKELAFLRAETGGKLPQRVDIYKDAYAWIATTALTRVASSNGYDPLALTRFIQARRELAKSLWHVAQIEDLNSPLLRFVGPRFILSRDALNSPNLELALDAGGRRVYRYTAALPRFFMAKKLTPVRSLDEAVAKMSFTGWNPSEETFVEGLDAAPASPGAGAVDVLSFGTQELRLWVDAPSKAFLVTSEQMYPGWYATVSGTEVPIYYTNAAFRGIFVPPGKHEVRFVYRPDFFPLLALISGFSWVYLLARSGIELRRRRLS